MKDRNKIVSYDEALSKVFELLGTHRIMALASSVDDHVSVRNVSGIIYENRIFFKTDKNFSKTKQFIQNPNVAICHWGVSIEGKVQIHGLVKDDPTQKFAELYKKYWDKSYTSAPHIETEILVEVLPSFIEVWDQDEKDCGFQTIIDCVKHEVEIRYYDDNAEEK